MKGASKVFMDIKKRIVEAYVLKLPNFSKVFKVVCDASDIVIGGVLN